MTAPQISPDYLTLINTFTVEPERAEELLAVLSKATVDTMRHLPGFVSATLHMSQDRRHVANYAQWLSREHFDAMLANPDAQPHMREAAGIATSFAPLLYQVRESHSRESAA